MLRKILILLFCLNLISSLITLGRKEKQKNDDYLRVSTTFEELDQIMSHSEFHEVWKKVRNNILNGEMDPELLDEFEKIRPIEMREKDKEKNYDDEFDELDYDLILGSSSSSCLLSKEKTTDILEKDYGILDNNPNEDQFFKKFEALKTIMGNMTIFSNDSLKKLLNCLFVQSDFNILKTELSNTFAKKITLFSMVIILANLALFISIMFGVIIVSNYKGSNEPEEIENHDRHIKMKVSDPRNNMDSSSAQIRK